MKLWEKGCKVNKSIGEFTAGTDYLWDQKLVKFDCLASIAHAKMLREIGILKEQEAKKLIKALGGIIELDKKGKFLIKKEQEDCHTAIENHLTKKLGSLGGKIHTGRSRNDQVLGALRLYYKEELSKCRELSREFIGSIEKFVKKYGKIRLPGYTHSRKAMPSSIRLWGGSFIDSLKDNLKLIEAAFELIDQSPLGGGAGYGVPIKIDKNYVAKILKFKKIQANSLYCQNSRGKFESTILHALTQIMFDLNKIASDLIIFSMPEFGYFELPKEFCTGSSIMPQKKNPDVLELVRAKYHVVVSYEFQIKNLTANLLSGYSRDLQLTKESTMKGLDTTEECLSVMTLVFKNMEVNGENCEKALSKDVFATERVYKLVKKGMPFREAYRKISKDENF
ncbi:MAG: argininosuccinate lyase [Candidatus Paceibacterota bacterium]